MAEPSDPATEEGWSKLHRGASRRMRAAIRKIDHRRRLELIDREIDGRLATGEKAELDALQAACDAATREHDELICRYNDWKFRRMAGDDLATRVDKTYHCNQI